MQGDTELDERAITAGCRICAGTVTAFLDLGVQPLSDHFPRPGTGAEEFTYRLVVGSCADCSMVQLLHEVDRDRMFHQDYPYRSSLSTVMSEHFADTARLLRSSTAAPDPFVVEIGSNDGVMLRTLAEAGVRHLGVEPSAGVAQLSRAQGVAVLERFFERATAEEIRAEHGPADVVYAANTLCHIPYVNSVLGGVDALLSPDGVFVFEDPYLGDIVAKTSFDQIYDEHFFLFSVTSVAEMARRSGLELVDATRLPVHGGEMRYTLARRGSRPVSAAVDELIAQERQQELHTRPVLRAFAADVAAIRDELLDTLGRLRAEGRTVIGYGATAKSATVLNYCRIGPELIARIHDSTPEKQGRLTPLSHIPIVAADEFGAGAGDYAVLFAWNHAEEIQARESAFAEAGGRWITYVPEVVVR